MNKNIRFIITFFALLFCFCSNAYARTENSGSVNAKYKLIKDDSFIEFTLIQNNKTSIELEDRTISIVSNNSKDDGISVIIVPVNNNAFDWLTSGYSDKSNLVGYYINFYKKNEKVSLNGTLNIKIESCTSCNLEKVYFYDTNKKIIDNANNVNNNLNLDINKSGYLLFRNNILKTINLNISENGDFVIDNKAYSNNGNIYSDSSEKEVLIRPNQGYVIDKVLLNNNDITSSVNGNYLLLNLNDSNNLNITFKKEKEIVKEESFDIRGNISEDGKPVINAKVELHSDLLVTYTDELGNFKFENVKPGNHTITLEDSKNVLGYSSFIVNTGENKNVEIVSNDEITEITINKKTSIINIDLDLDNNMRFNYNNVYTIIKGDVNTDGLVNITDLVQLRRYLAKLILLTDKGLEAADIKEDKKVDITDLIKLRRYLAGLEKF